MARHFGGETALPGVPVEQVLALGAETWRGGDPKLFNMAAMGLRLAQRANGVSTLHGEVSRSMFNGLWPGFDAADVPITSVTNGVHAATWIDPAVVRLGAAEIGADRAEEAMTTGETKRWTGLERIGNTEVWDLRRTLRAQLVDEVRHRLRASWHQRGAGEAELGWVSSVLDPDVLTIGFARRVPSYKRLTLMLRDPERLRAMLLHPTRPVQIVVAGKAHPADDGGKRLIQQMVAFADDPAVRHRIVFLPDYDMAMARHLYPGCDVWLNNPLRPLEACGTSGMKAALNGCLNLSVLDGWWDEWFDGQNGWAIPTADTGDGVLDPDSREAERRDDIEAAALYDLIEDQVATRFYDRGSDGLPHRWIAMVRHTLVTLGPKVLAGRMVREYVERLYVPAAQAQRELVGQRGAPRRPGAGRVEGRGARGLAGRPGGARRGGLPGRGAGAGQRPGAEGAGDPRPAGAVRRRGPGGLGPGGRVGPDLGRQPARAQAGRRARPRRADQVRGLLGARPHRPVRLHGAGAALAPPAGLARRAGPGGAAAGGAGHGRGPAALSAPGGAPVGPAPRPRGHAAQRADLFGGRPVRWTSGFSGRPPPWRR